MVEVVEANVPYLPLITLPSQTLFGENVCAMSLCRSKHKNGINNIV